MFLRDGGSTRSRLAFTRPHSINVKEIFGLSSLTEEDDVQFILPIIRIMTATKVYYMKLDNWSQLRGWMSALKVVVDCSTATGRKDFENSLNFSCQKPLTVSGEVVCMLILVRNNCFCSSGAHFPYDLPFFSCLCFAV